MRLVVVGAMTIQTEVGAASLEPRGFNTRHPPVEGLTGGWDGIRLLSTWGHVGRPQEACPFLAAIARDPQRTVVGPHPEHVGVLRRFGERGAAAAFGVGDFRRDDLAVVAAVERLEDELAGAVEDLGVVVREDVRRVAVDAMLRSLLA